MQEPEPEPVQEDEQEIEDDAAPEEVPEIEDPVPTPLPARGGKKRAAPTSAKKGSTKAAPAQTAPISPVPGLVPIAVSRVPSPNENVEVQQEPAQKKGRKKLYNGAEKKSRKPEFRKVLFLKKTRCENNSSQSFFSTVFGADSCFCWSCDANERCRSRSFGRRSGRLSIDVGRLAREQSLLGQDAVQMTVFSLLYKNQVSKRGKGEGLK